MKQKKTTEPDSAVDSVAFVFVPDLTEDNIPWRQVHFGYDFSGGKVVNVSSPFVIRKLDGNRFFGRVDKQGKLLPDQWVNSESPPPPEKVSNRQFPRKRRARMEDSDPDILDPALFDDKRA